MALNQPIKGFPDRENSRADLFGRSFRDASVRTVTADRMLSNDRLWFLAGNNVHTGPQGCETDSNAPRQDFRFVAFNGHPKSPTFH